MAELRHTQEIKMTAKVWDIFSNHSQNHYGISFKLVKECMHHSAMNLEGHEILTIFSSRLSWAKLLDFRMSDQILILRPKL